LFVSRAANGVWSSNRRSRQTPTGSVAVPRLSTSRADWRAYLVSVGIVSVRCVIVRLACARAAFAARNTIASATFIVGTSALRVGFAHMSVQAFDCSAAA
jgi:hypothetical protein